jgi:hypothetical protein
MVEHALFAPPGGSLASALLGPAGQWPCADSLARISSSDNLLILNIFLADERPDDRLTSDFGISNASASTAPTASLALPFSGCAVTRILSESPSQPSILVREEPGTTFTFNSAKASILCHRMTDTATALVENFEMRIEYQPQGVSEWIYDAGNLDVATDVLKRCMWCRAEAQ